MNEVVEVTDDNILVRKSVVGLGTDTVTGIEFTITSHASTPITFRLVEELPNGVSTRDIGLNPDYHADSWTTFPEQNRLVFQDRIEPDEEIKTLWGIRTETLDDTQPFLNEPTIEVTYPTDADVDKTEPAADDTKPPESLEALWETEHYQGMTRSSAAESEEWDFDSDAYQTDESDSLVSTLIAEIQSGTVEDTELEILRDALEIETPHSLRIRTRWLQSQVADLVAYGDELETFIDEKGSPEDLVDAFEQQLRDLESRIAAIENDRKESDERQVAVRERLAALESRVTDVEDLEADLHRVQYQVEELEDYADDDTMAQIEALETEVEGALTAIRDDLDRLTADVEEFRAWRERLADLLGSLEDPTE